MRKITLVFVIVGILLFLFYRINLKSSQKSVSHLKETTEVSPQLSENINQTDTTVSTKPAADAGDLKISPDEKIDDKEREEEWIDKEVTIFGKVRDGSGIPIRLEKGVSIFSQLSLFDDGMKLIGLEACNGTNDYFSSQDAGLIWIMADTDASGRYGMKIKYKVRSGNKLNLTVFVDTQVSSQIRKNTPKLRTAPKRYLAQEISEMIESDLDCVMGRLRFVITLTGPNPREAKILFRIVSGDEAFAHDEVHLKDINKYAHKFDHSYDLPVGLPFDVELHCSGWKKRTENITPLLTNETRVVEVVMKKISEREFIGKCIDKNGSPVPKAEVLLRQKNSEVWTGFTSVTNDLGEFTFIGITDQLADEVSITLKKNDLTLKWRFKDIDLSDSKTFIVDLEKPTPEGEWEESSNFRY
ncbi:MAG: hypothetical protein HY606_05805 [Planctomycetes bacterium]|nr:hypothetical protein [Planctomycetota bacterium]